MKKLDFAIGKKLPLDILMQPVFLGGGRGSGKTSGAKTLYEAAYDAGAQCIAIAPTGKWYSLRLDADGKSPGLTDVFVFGGPHADVPLTPEAGATIAKLLVEKRIHAVLDVSLMRKGERARFLAAFLEEFWLLKKLENESFPVVVFIEEAHAVVPQRPQPEEARMLGAAEDLVREGRNHGIGVVLLDQRAAVVNKNVLALVEVLIVLRTIHHLDRKTFAEWVVEKGTSDREWLDLLPSLKAGAAYLYAPVLELFDLVQMRMPRTFNATATARIGERTVKMGQLTPVDVGALRESMAGVIVEAEKNDPKALKREIVKAELAQKPAAAPAPKPETVIKPIIGPEMAVQIQTLAIGVKGLAGAISELLQKYPTDAGPAHAVPAPRPPVRPEARQRTAPAPSLPRLARGESGLTKGMRAVLTAVAQHNDGVSREQLSVLTGYKRSSRDTYLQQLGAADLVEFGTGDKAFATADGVAALGAGFEPLPTGEALRAHWLGRLPQGERRIFSMVVEAYPHAIARETIGESTGYKRSSRDTYLQKLSARKLIVADRGEVTASEALFS